MSEPESIVDAIDRVLGPHDLDGWSVLVSAGGTREAIDPVRYIGNRSSGKMGNAIARAASRRGAQVTLVTTAAPPEDAAVEIVAVETAAEMAEAVWGRAGGVDVAVLAAAVADFKPDDAADTKLKRLEGAPQIRLVPTADILAGVAAMETDRPYLVGFAAETGSLDDAAAKAERKGVDLLVANDVAKKGSGFGSDTNEVTVITPGGPADAWSLLTKDEVADRLWDRIIAERADS
jgi:phosphopantothenoylcysteine decarboxylase/phosphopantothenate--cysteine ligase